MTLLTTEAAAHLLGVTQPTVRNWTREGQLKSIEVDGRLFFKEAWLKDFILTPQRALSAADLEDLHTPPALARLLLDYDVRVRRALLHGASDLDEIPPPSKTLLEAARKESGEASVAGIFQGRLF